MKYNFSTITLSAIISLLFVLLFVSIYRWEKHNEEIARHFTMLYCSEKLDTFGVDYEKGNFSDICAKYDSLMSVKNTK